MKRRRLVMFGALALGLVFGFLVILTFYGQLGLQLESSANVMVAAHDLPVGSRIEEHDIKIIRIPSSDLPPSALRKRSDVIGHDVLIPISKGEFILLNRLARENAGSGLPALIPPGMRAVSVRVNEGVSVAGFVTPGTRVDVLLTEAPSGAGEQEEKPTTVLQNVTVLAYTPALHRWKDPPNTAVITLLVTPDDAKRLTLAISEGYIQLVPRSPLDTKPEKIRRNHE